MTSETPEVCGRCGDFGPFPVQIFGRGVCEGCLATDEGGVLLRFKRESWGRRDIYVGLAVFSALFSLMYLIAAISTALQIPSPEMTFIGVLSATLFVTNVAYIVLFRWARLAHVILSLAIPAAIVIGVTIAEGRFEPALFGFFGIAGVIAFVIARSAYRDARNKLAFKIDVDQSELEAYYEAKVSNPWAANGEVFGVLGMLIPIFAPLGLLISLKGLRAVDLSVWPPVSGRSTAINGIVTSLIGLLWGSVFFSVMFLA